MRVHTCRKSFRSRCMHYCQCHWRVQSWYPKPRLCCPAAWPQQSSVAGRGATEALQSSPKVNAYIFTCMPVVHGYLRHKLQRISRLSCCQFRCQSIEGSCCSYSKKTTAAETKTDRTSRSHLLDSEVIKYHKLTQIYRLSKNAQAVSMSYVAKFTHVSAICMCFLNVRSAYVLYLLCNQETPVHVCVLH